MKRLPTLCIDFDGVIHSYTSRWRSADVISDPPVAGAFEALEKYVDNFDVCIFSTRNKNSGFREAFYQWSKKYGLPERVFNKLSFPIVKPPCILLIDDRAFLFKGVFPGVGEIKFFKPWNKFPKELNYK